MHLLFLGEKEAEHASEMISGKGDARLIGSKLHTFTQLRRMAENRVVEARLRNNV